MTVQVTSAAQQDAWTSGGIPAVELVREGLWSVAVPLPGSKLRYTLLYVLELPDGVAVVDAGWDAEQTWHGLVAGLASIGFRPEHVRAVLATHVHTDHYGLAGRIRQESGAWLALHPLDAAMLRDPGDEDSRRELAEQWETLRRRIGTPTPPSGSADPLAAARSERKYLEQPRPDVLLADGDPVPLPGWNLRPIWTPGHSPGHLCFHEPDRGLLFGGDHVLPGITPHVSVHSRQRPDPLGDYLGSLATVARLPEVEVLPGHQYRFRGLHERVDSIVGHHREKLAAIEQVLARAPASTCWEVARALSWSRPFDTLTPALRASAARETLAHLVLLEQQGRGHAVTAAGDPDHWFAGPSSHSPL